MAKRLDQSLSMEALVGPLSTPDPSDDPDMPWCSRNSMQASGSQCSCERCKEYWDSVEPPPENDPTVEDLLGQILDELRGIAALLHEIKNR